MNGNYTWGHTDFNLFDQNPANGSSSNVIEADTLIKTTSDMWGIGLLGE